MLTPERVSEFDKIRAKIIDWARTEQSVCGVALVGSWARREARMDSDVDVVILTSDVQRFVHDDAWLKGLMRCAAEIVATRSWGPLTERRARLRSGLEVEFGFVNPTWARIKPVDPGTARVVSDGCQVLYDPDGLLGRLVRPSN